VIVYYYPPHQVVTEPPAIVVADPPKPAQDDKLLDLDELYKKVVKSCVYIVTPRKGGFSEGIGSLIDVDRKLVLTSYHVVGDEDMVYVQFPIYDKAGEIVTAKEKYKERVVTGLAIRGRVLYRDKTRDLAFVRLDRVPVEATEIPLARRGPRKGETVYQVGNTGDVAQVFRISRGEVSSVEEVRFGNTGTGDMLPPPIRKVTATTPGGPGESGGPLFDKRGYLVAVAESGSGSVNLVHQFIDVTEVYAFLKEKKLHGKVPPKIPERKAGDPSSPTADDEKTAAQKLRVSKLFANGEDNRPTYIAKLKEIVAKWPNTSAGKAAKQLLDALK
jgi:S1-C subfamily serine protease